MSDKRDPQAGDFVILRGRIRTVADGVALIEVHRTYPVGCTVPVQCGALELDEKTSPGALVGTLAEAVRADTEQPGRVFTVEEPAHDR